MMKSASDEPNERCLNWLPLTNPTELDECLSHSEQVGSYHVAGKPDLPVWLAGTHAVSNIAKLQVSAQSEYREVSVHCPPVCIDTFGDRVNREPFGS